MSTGRLEGRVALVTGAGFSIGRGIARRFAREGAAVVVAEIDGGSHLNGVQWDPGLPE